MVLSSHPHSKKTSFDLFVIYMSIVISTNLYLGYDFLTQAGLRYSLFFLSGPGTFANYFHSQIFSLPPFLTFAPAHYIHLQVFGLIGLTIPKVRRVGAVIFFLGILLSSAFYETYSVLNNFNFIFALGMLLFPTDRQIEQRNFILGGFAAGWLASGFNKMTGTFFSGEAITLNLDRLARPYLASIMKTNTYAQWVGFIGVTSQLMASFIGLREVRFNRLGLFFILCFITGVAVQINGGLGVLRYFLGLPFLLSYRWATSRLLMFLLIWPLLFPLALNALNSEIQTFEHASSILFIICTILSIAPILKNLLMNTQETTMSLKNWQSKALGFGLVIFFVLICRAFHFPIPLGWTQYSGIYDNKNMQLLLLEQSSDKTLSERLNFNRWDHRLIQIDENRMLLSAPSKDDLTPVLKYICQQKSLDVQYVFSEDKYTTIMKIYDREFANSYISQKMPKPKHLDCSDLLKRG